MKIYDVVTFGANGTGIVPATQAIQQTIDVCAAEGGGTVLVPSGRYLIGTVYLKSYVSLVLDAGAVLLASTDRNEYEMVNVYQSTDNPTAYPANICAIGVSGVTISGRGRLDGQDQSFWIAKEGVGDSSESTLITYKPKEWRPMSILFEYCDDVWIEGITISNCSTYAGWLIDCNRVNINGVTISNDLRGPNSDGFHLSSCQYVTIANSHFQTGDDSIAIDANGSQEAGYMTITNCTFHTSVNCFRIYTGLDPWLKKRVFTRVSQIAISNCSVSEAAGFINLTAEDGEIAGILITGITLQMNIEGVPIFLMTNRGSIRRISISQVIAEANGVCTVVGQPGDCIEQVQITQSQFEITPRKKKYGLGIPENIAGYAYHHFSPYFIYIRHAVSISFDQVRVRWTENTLSDCWSLVHAEHIGQLSLHRVQGAAYGDNPDVPVITLHQVGEVEVTEMKVEAAATVFICLTGDQAEQTRVRLTNNHLELIKTEVQFN
ncbi:hypothetical protein GC096_15255 [Paenibacillus sp. LMG 31461]|uniref:Uncharacterized protein n=1 Tax=Paenibacillus plantarum TaxID=2654975 RepID=A0ABX1XBS2_9BACL|nr:glycosyl hydrolase family 28 protein [Paenibacillus plantarum]NOU65390.1 hypothetical protein [Paenibacillus plantarum]